VFEKERFCKKLIMRGNIGLYVYRNEGFPKYAVVYMEVIERFLVIGYGTTLSSPTREI
jgi:hypothetical protein